MGSEPLHGPRGRRRKQQDNKQTEKQTKTGQYVCRNVTLDDNELTEGGSRPNMF